MSANGTGTDDPIPSICKSCCARVRHTPAGFPGWLRNGTKDGLIPDSRKKFMIADATHGVPVGPIPHGAPIEPTPSGPSVDLAPGSPAASAFRQFAINRSERTAFTLIGR